MTTSGLLTDLYELTMMQGYYLYGRNPEVVFDMFYRRPPFGAGFSVFAGLEEIVRRLGELSFSQEDLEYLDGLGLFHRKFLDMLASFRFNGTVYAMKEGTVVFPQEPLLRVHGTLIEAQLVESMLLAIVNFQSLIATKAARIYLASGGGNVIEFGLRRAQGLDGALSATRAAFIGGAAATSNTLAGKLYDIPVRGTMAHSWVMAFENELDAFEKYAALYPDQAILLIDTYDTLGSGVENAIRIGRKLKKQGKRLGVRLDSGDLEYLSKQCRRRLDDAGLQDARIIVSNELNEEIIQQLVTAGSPIDSWGVGTQLVTGGNESAFSGVYKLAAKREGDRMIPTIKLSNNPEKTTTPAVKQVHRYYDSAGSPLGDLMTLDDEQLENSGPVVFHHPMDENRRYVLRSYERSYPLLELVMKSGKRVHEPAALTDLRARALDSIRCLDDTYKRLINPHVYKVSLSGALQGLKFSLVKAAS